MDLQPHIKMCHIIGKSLIGLLLILSACSQSNIRHLEQAEYFVMHEPERSKRLLDEIENPESLSKEQRMRYHLIQHEIKYKTFQEISSDTLMLEVLTFFDKKGDVPRLLRSFYCLGGIYADLGEAPKAQKCFLEAMHFADDYEEMYPSLFGRIYNHCGTLYLYQFLYDEALPLLKKASVCIEMAEDNKSLSYIYRDIARAYHTIEIPDSSGFYYEKSIEKANLHNDDDKDLATSISCEHISFLLTQNNTKSVNKFMTDDLMQQIKKDSIDQRFLVLGHYYLIEMQIDSAAHYLKLCINSENIATRNEAYFHLSNLEEMTNNIETALSHARMYEEIQDTISQTAHTKLIKQVHEMYNYERIEAENQSLKLKRKIFTYRIISAATVFILTLSILYLIKKRKEKKEKEQAIRREQLLTSKYQTAKTKLIEKKLKIMNLEEDITNHKDKLSSAQLELYQTQKRLLEITENKYILQNEENTLLKQSLQCSSIYRKFHDAEKDDSIRITKEDWSELQTIINQTYDDFTVRFKHYYPALTDIELQVCLLIKSELTITGIARIVHRSKQMVSMCRSRLYKKITGNTGSAEELDDFINDF